MLRSLSRKTEESIILPEDEWSGRIDFLREEARRGELICPVCKQPVVVRAGEIRIHHFAHRNLGDCPMANEEGAVLLARSLLFRWLSTKYPGRVTIEQELPESSLPRPVDCWVETDDGKCFAYWILAKRSSDAKTRGLVDAMGETGALATWVLLNRILTEGEVDGQVLLSTMERVLLEATRFDCVYRPFPDAFGRSLHYLNIDKKTVTTCRCLRPYESPQLYAGHSVGSDLSTLLIDPADGSFVHQGEYERAQPIWVEDKRRREERERWQDGGNAAFSSLGRSLSTFQQPPSDSSYIPLYERTPVCKHCGKRTKDWLSHDGKTDTCVCRECYRKAHSEKT